MAKFGWVCDIISDFDDEIDRLSNRVNDLQNKIERDEDNNNDGGFWAIFFGKTSDDNEESNYESGDSTDDLSDHYTQGNDHTATWGWW